MARILGIETSCDETGVAVVEDGRRILANEVASQIKVHAQYGGVVPEIASRQHTTCISQLTRTALEAAGGRIDAVAATRGPGLMGSLLVGLSFGKALAYAWDVPFIPVHHIEGHLFSPFLTDDPPSFPFLALIVSGGHTQLTWCPEPHRYEMLGATRDDAAGECFDKAARLLGLPYPGGPSVQKAAETGNPNAFDLPRGLRGNDSLEFSYSGLKTAVLYAVRERPEVAQDPAARADLAASFQWAAVDALLEKTKLAIERTGAQRLVLAGGVAANALLRQRLTGELAIPVHMPPLALCLDNGAMIAAAADSLLRHGRTSRLDVTAVPGLALA